MTAMPNPATVERPIFFNCPDCAETAEKAVAAGGKLLQEKFRIANGFAAFIEDTEGNRIGLHSMR